MCWNSPFEAAHIQAQEAARSLRNYQQRLELDPQRLAITERRMSEIHAVARKYRAKPDELPNLLNESQARLAALDMSANVAALARQEQAARAQYLELGRRLSDGRRKAAATFGGKVAKALQSLAMADARFEVNLIPLDEGASYGLEKTEFLFASHRSLALGSLDKIASGGELSRVGLAIQVVASKVARVPTLIFDEVDSGIGGGVAEVVGQMLKALGKSHQVMCVTHLPQVAAQGDQHWKVAKEYAKSAVTSRIEVLDKSQRIEELARMLGGVTITAATRKHAAELLGANA